jgi:hypothetical protein
MKRTIKIKFNNPKKGNENNVENTVEKTPSNSTPTPNPTPRRMNIAMWNSKPLILSSMNMGMDKNLDLVGLVGKGFEEVSERP